MPAKKTSATKPTDALDNTAAVAAPVVASAETKAPKKAKATKKAADTAVPVVAPVVAASTEEVVVDASVDVEAALADRSVEFLAKLQQATLAISSLKTDYRNLEKAWSRELKAALKASSKRKRKSGNRQPSGFVKPTRISDELAAFLGKEKGTEMARTAVTRDINAYIRSNNLQDKVNGRKINPDSKLVALLKLKKEDELTYFNLQRFMSPHFTKTVKPVKDAVESATA